MEILDTIKKQIEENDVILYMKGSPNAPQCGFSSRTSQAIMACGKRFAYVDILSNPEIRQSLPGYANLSTVVDQGRADRWVRYRHRDARAG